MNNKNRNTSQQVLQSAQAIEATEFSTIFGSNANPAWFEWLMAHAGTYLFSTALILFVFKLGILTYRFIKSPNKNIKESATLGFHALHTAVIATAIVGALVAATAFALITPILFTGAMALDTLRNIGGFFWNLGKLASLRFSLRKKLKEDTFTKIKYDAYKEKYLSNIKQHGIGSIVGLFVTTAVAVIFLLPHVGVTIGSIGLTIFGIKTTVAGLLGTSAAAALMGSLTPLFKAGFSKLFNFLKKKLNREKKCDLIIEEDSQLEQQVLLPKNQPKLVIRNRLELNAALDHQIDFNPLSLHSGFRETIIDGIDDFDLAKSALLEMINEKIAQLSGEIKLGEKSGYRYFADKQRHKREQKLHALLLMKQQLSQPGVDVFQGYKSLFKNFSNLHTDRFEDYAALLKFIECLPGVRESFFLEQSDTLNIVAAFNKFAEKFDANLYENYRPALA